MLNKLLLLLSVSLTLTGCVTYGGNPSHYTKEGEDKVNYNYVLFKGLGMGTSGTSTPLTSHYSLTTSAIADRTSQVKQYTSNICGLTIVKQDNSKKTLPILGAVKPGDNLKSYGYDYYTGKLKTSTGKAIQLIEAKEYINPDENCIVYEATTGNDDGMNGGPVFNDKNELVGILAYSVHMQYHSDIDQDEKFDDIQFGKLVVRHMNQAYKMFSPEYDVRRIKTKVNYSIFVPLSSVKGWLNSAMRTTSDFDEFRTRDDAHNQVMKYEF